MNQEYYTIEEVAGMWNLLPRRIQYLCKQQRIEGAVKKGGIWFIPKDARLPSRHGQADAARFQFTGTKKRIFDCAVKLFVAHGYGEVSIRDIMQAVGIHPSALYHYFGSKQQILDTVYDYYRHYYLLGRPSMEDIEPILRNGSLLDIIKCVIYDFDDDYRDHLLDITKLLFQRSAIDSNAGDITKSLMVDEGVRFVEAVFDRAVQIGRLAPLDTHAMAVFINGIRVFMMLNWMIDGSPESILKMGEVQSTIYLHAAKILTDLKATPDGQSGAL